LLVIQFQIWIPHHLSISLIVAEQRILDLLAFFIQSPADLHDTQQND